MEDITDADYKLAKKVCNKSEVKHFGEYHHFYVQRNKLLLANVFENFRVMCGLDPTHFLSAPGKTWQAAFKKSKVKLELLTTLICY